MLELALQKNLHAATGDMLLDIDLKIPWGQVINLFGPSGAGKTSILRMLAGLMMPDSGRISVKGDVWYDSQSKVIKKPRERRIGFIFQDYALFPNMTVRQNLTYALDKKQSPAIVEELIELIELGDLRNRKPETLSGGQKQRVALARALVRKPDLLLLDEPLSALDMEMRQKLQSYILHLHKKYALTTILVSHDIGEVFKMSDLVMVLEHGKIVRSGNPADIFSSLEGHHSKNYIGKVIEIANEGVAPYLKVTAQGYVHKVYYLPEEGLSLKIGDSVLVTPTHEHALVKKVKG